MKRDTFLDSLKFLLIILVVLGHALGLANKEDVLAVTSMNVIYSFHMPLFVFISGYFSKTNDAGKLKKHLLKIFETYVVVQIIGYMPEVVSGNFVWKYLITPWWVSWYLLSLCFWKIIAFFVLKTSFNKYLIIATSFTLGIFVGFVEFIDYPLSLSRTFVFLPFFLIGATANETLINRIRRPHKLISLLYFIALFFFFFSSGSDYLSVFRGANGNPASGDPVVFVWQRFAYYTLACLGSIAFINISIDNRKTSIEGKNTITYYIYHAFILFIIRIVLLKLNYSPSFIELIFLSIAILFSIYLFSKLFPQKWILNPISSILTRKRIN